MTKQFPRIRINTDSKEKLEKVISLLDEMDGAKFVYEYYIPNKPSSRHIVLDVLYAGNNEDFLIERLDELHKDSKNEMIPILVIFDPATNNEFPLSNIKQDIFDFVILPINSNYLQHKISQLLFLSEHRNAFEISKMNFLMNKGISEKLIVEYKETKDALEHSENLYRSIFENANDGIVLYDANTLKPVDINPSALYDLGYTKEEFLKLENSKHIIYSQANPRDQVLKELYATKQVKFKVSQLTKSGQIKHKIINSSIITINKTNYILGIVHDITDLTNAENAIKEKQLEINNLQDNIFIGLFRADADGTIIYANKYMANILNAPNAKSLIGENILKFVYAAHQVKVLWREINNRNQIKNLELEIINKKNKKAWVLLNLQKINNQPSKTVYYDGSFEDISALKKTQLELEKANNKISKINKTLESKIQKAILNEKKQQEYIIQKSKLESLGELAAGIAHEINQPLGIMTLAFENLHLRINNKSATKEYLEQKINSIIANIDRIKDIINHIRIFSREQDSFIIQKVNVNQVILNVNKLIKTQYQNHNIHIIYDLAENLGFTVGSRLKLEQVILNLLSNAKYALDDYESSHHDENYLKTIEIKTFLKSKRINLTVQDNGIGIASKNLSKIFDPFYTTKPEWVGTGLGLSIIYGIIKEMHGEIKVYSKQNKYTRFEISLPRFPEKEN
jgi:PAS domain S-box-containing protein